MEEEKKLTFFKKLKFSIFDFDKYQDLATEKILKTIGYIAILVCLFALIVTGIFTYAFSVAIIDIREYIDENIETVTFEDNVLTVTAYSQEEEIVMDNEDVGIKFIVYTDTENEEKVQEEIDALEEEENAILILNSQVIIKSDSLTDTIAYSYEDLAEEYSVSTFDKDEVLNFLSYDNIEPLIVTVFWVFFIYFFVIIYLPSTLIDIFILSVFGYIVSLITKVKLRYSAIYNIAAYSITLPIILNMIYVIINYFTGFTINYFEVMYTTIASIYIAAAILIIRSDIYKREIELTKIIEEQDKVRLELQRREEEEKEQEEKERQKKEEEKKRKKEKEKEEKENLGKEPEGNNV